MEMPGAIFVNTKNHGNDPTNAERQQLGWSAIFCHPAQGIWASKGSAVVFRTWSPSYIYTAVTSPSLMKQNRMGVYNRKPWHWVWKFLLALEWKLHHLHGHILQNLLSGTYRERITVRTLPLLSWGCFTLHDKGVLWQQIDLLWGFKSSLSWETGTTYSLSIKGYTRPFSVLRRIDTICPCSCSSIWDLRIL